MWQAQAFREHSAFGGKHQAHIVPIGSFCQTNSFNPPQSGASVSSIIQEAGSRQAFRDNETVPDKLKSTSCRCFDRSLLSKPASCIGAAGACSRTGGNAHLEAVASDEVWQTAFAVELEWFRFRRVYLRAIRFHLELHPCLKPPWGWPLSTPFLRTDPPGDGTAENPEAWSSHLRGH